MTLGDVPSERQIDLESLSLAGSKWRGMMGYAGPQLTQLNLSGTNVTDEELRCITQVACTAPPFSKRNTW